MKTFFYNLGVIFVAFALLGTNSLIFLGSGKPADASIKVDAYSKLIKENKILGDEIVVRANDAAALDRLNLNLKQKKSRGITAEALTGKQDPISNVVRIKLPPNLSVAAAIDQFSKIEGVTVSPNVIYRATAAPDDTYYPKQWALNNTGQTGGTSDADIDAPEAWDKSTGSSGVVIAIIDSGIQLDHPDLAGNLWENPGEVSGGTCLNNGTDDDSNGYVNDCYGYDFVSTFQGSGANYPRDNDPSPCGNNILSPNTADCNGIDDDSSGGIDNLVMHGTHVAGIAAAVQDDTFGVSGVAPSVEIMSVRALTEDGIGITSDVLAAINYAIAEGADVINMSFGSDTFDSSFNAVVNSAVSNDVVLVAAAGNKNEDLISGTNCDSPACNDDPNDTGINGVLGVAATTDKDRKASFSNYSSAGYVDVSAPGNSILSTCYDTGTSVACSAGSETGSEPAEFSRLSGTSMATPFASGAAALLKSAYPSLTRAEIIEAIKMSADDVTAANAGLAACGGVDCASGLSGTLGQGRLNINNMFSPLLVGSNPSSAKRGQTVSLALTGINTSFSGSTTLDLNTGIKVNSLTCPSATSCTANATVTNSAPLGYHKITLTTGAEKVSHEQVLKVSGDILRLAGANRVETGIAVSQNYFPTKTASNVIVTRKDNFPDSLTGAPLASLANGPVLFTDSKRLESSVNNEIIRVLDPTKNATIYMLGGESALSGTVGNSLKKISSKWHVQRLGGKDRYDTARIIANKTNSIRGSGPSKVMITPGNNFPDALSAAVPAGDDSIDTKRMPILLTKSNTLPGPTRDYLSANAASITSGYVIGGPAVISDSVVQSAAGLAGPMQRLWGNDRYLTAKAVADHFYSKPISVSFAAGLNFPDALAGGPHSADRSSPLLLIKGSQIPQATLDYVNNKKSSLLGGYLYGGTSVIPNNVKTQLESNI